MILIITPFPLQAGSFARALKRENFDIITVHPMDLDSCLHLRPRGLFIPHTLSLRLWDRLAAYVKDGVRNDVPVVLYGCIEDFFWGQAHLENLIRRIAPLNGLLGLENLPRFFRDLLGDEVHEDYEELRLGSFSLKNPERVLNWAHGSVTLNRKEYHLMEMLFRYKDQLVTRERLVGGVWDDHRFVAPNTLDVYMSRLRKKIRPLVPRLSIETVPCLGYTLTTAT